MKRKILICILVILCVAGAFCAIYFPNSEINETIEEAQNIVIEEIQNEIVVTEEAQEIADNTIEAVENGEDLSTTEEITSNEEEEQELEEESLEVDGTVEQENISYDGDNTAKGTSLLGSYQGLTYYSQADSRWASVMYSSTNNSSQTIKSSGCRSYSGSNDS